MIIKAENMEQLDKAIKEHPKILVDFSGMRCRPCQVFEARLKRMVSEYPSIDAVEIVVDAIPDGENIAGKYDVSDGVPDIRFYENGKQMDRILGWSDTNDDEEVILEEWFKVVKIFLMDFKNDIYQFARVGDRVIELEEKSNSHTVLPIKDKTFELGKMWSSAVDGKEINKAIAPRKIGVMKSPVTKWRINEIREV